MPAARKRAANAGGAVVVSTRSSISSRLAICQLPRAPSFSVVAATMTRLLQATIARFSVASSASIAHTPVSPSTAQGPGRYTSARRRCTWANASAPTAPPPLARRPPISCTEVPSSRLATVAICGALVITVKLRAGRCWAIARLVEPASSSTTWPGAATRRRGRQLGLVAAVAGQALAQRRPWAVAARRHRKRAGTCPVRPVRADRGGSNLRTRHSGAPARRRPRGLLAQFLQDLPGALGEGAGIGAHVASLHVRAVTCNNVHAALGRRAAGLPVNPPAPTSMDRPRGPA